MVLTLDVSNLDILIQQNPYDIMGCKDIGIRKSKFAAGEDL